MIHPEKVAEKVGALLKAETKLENKTCQILKKRTLEIYTQNTNYICSLELDISFCRPQEDGTAINKAEIFLLPEELPAFSYTLKKHLIPFPTDFSQKIVSNPYMLSVSLNSKEPPACFAERLSIALEAISESNGRVYIN